MDVTRFCECGCGTEIPPARYPSKQNRFVHNHHRPRLGAKLSDETKRKIGAANTKADPGSAAIHLWLLVKHPKTGVCERCGREARTDHAYKHHPLPYTRNREDYEELCRSCHKLQHYADKPHSTTPGALAQRKWREKQRKKS
jgi:hypothetical protein